MSKIDSILSNFLKDQSKRLKPRTFRDYESVIELFEIYLNNYGYQYLNEQDMKLWEEKYRSDEEAFTKMVDISKVSLESRLSEFLEYFIIRKVASGESFMKTAVRVMEKFAKWLYENEYISKTEYTEIKDYFSEGKDKSLPNAEKVADLFYDETNRNWQKDDNEYDEILEGYFTIEKIESEKLWLEDMFSDRTNIGPVIVSKEISDLCQVDWDVSLVIGKLKGSWYVLESGNVYPT